jgi:hypothetical protein
MGVTGKSQILLMCTAPLQAALWCSVPHVEEGLWNSTLFALTPFGFACIVTISFQLWEYSFDVVPVYALVLGYVSDQCLLLRG